MGIRPDTFPTHLGRPRRPLSALPEKRQQRLICVSDRGQLHRRRSPARLNIVYRLEAASQHSFVYFFAILYFSTAPLGSSWLRLAPLRCAHVVTFSARCMSWSWGGWSPPGIMQRAAVLGRKEQGFGKSTEAIPVKTLNVANDVVFPAVRNRSETRQIPLPGSFEKRSLSVRDPRIAAGGSTHVFTYAACSLINRPAKGSTFLPRGARSGARRRPACPALGRVPCQKASVTSRRRENRWKVRPASRFSYASCPRRVSISMCRVPRALGPAGQGCTARLNLSHAVFLTG